VGELCVGRGLPSQQTYPGEGGRRGEGEISTEITTYTFPSPPAHHYHYNHHPGSLVHPRHCISAVLRFYLHTLFPFISIPGLYSVGKRVILLPCASKKENKGLILFFYLGLVIRISLFFGVFFSTLASGTCFVWGYDMDTLLSFFLRTLLVCC